MEGIVEENLNYSKKQINPLIEKYHIKPTSNEKFKTIIKMFDNQTNYQIWGIKVVFNRFATLEQVMTIKDWADNNHQLIQKLSKKNIISYVKTDEITELFKEIEALSKYAVVKRNIEKFNTDQRNIFNRQIGKIENAKDAINNDVINKLFDLFNRFEKYSTLNQDNFLKKCSPVRDYETLITLLVDFFNKSWKWDKNDLIDFVHVNTPSTSIIYDDHNIVILNIKDYESSKKTCGGGKTSWCITREENHFNSYVIRENNKQMFMFNFNKNEDDDLSKIGFTVNCKKGIIHAHSMQNANLMPGTEYIYKKTGENVNIDKILNDFKVPMNIILNLHESYMNYKFNKEDLLAYMIHNDNKHSNVVYCENNIVVIQIEDVKDFNDLIGFSYLNAETVKLNKENGKVYVIYNFNKSIADNDAVLVCQIAIDDYDTETVSKMFNLYGCEVNLQNELSKIGIKSSDFLKQIELPNEILIQKLIDERDVDKAIKLLQENPDMDVNFEFKGKLPIFSAIALDLPDVFCAIVDHPKFDSKKLNSCGETVINEAISSYCFNDEEIQERIKPMIDKIFNSGKFDLNQKNSANETILMTCSIIDESNWIIEKLINDSNFDINTVNDDNETALTQAIQFENKEALKLLGSRNDLIVRDEDKILAQEYEIDLNQYISSDKHSEKNSKKSSEKEVEINNKEKEILSKIKKLLLS